VKDNVAKRKALHGLSKAKLLERGWWSDHPSERKSETSIDENNIGADYTPDEIEFIMAMDRWKIDNLCQFPEWHEVLAVAHSLGWRKT
jgi:hypothetical protein